MNDFDLCPELKDPISPVSIEHGVDEIIIAGELEQKYNFLTYHFEKYGAYCRADAYLDDIGTVFLRGPYPDREIEEDIEAPELYQEVLAYLKRRYLSIEVPGEHGFETIWEFAGYKRTGNTYAPFGRND